MENKESIKELLKEKLHVDVRNIIICSLSGLSAVQSFDYNKVNYTTDNSLNSRIETIIDGLIDLVFDEISAELKIKGAEEMKDKIINQIKHLSII